MREQLRAKGVEVFDKTHEWRASDGRHGVIISGGSSGQAVGACEPSDTEIIIKIEEREKARAAKDFTTSDRKRDELRAAGVDVFDKQRLWKTNDGRQGRIGVSAAAHLHAGKAPLTEFDIEQQLVVRERARAQKDWPTADRIREELSGVSPPELYQRFSDLARVESDCASAKEGGDLGKLEHEEMMEEFEEAVARIREGELSAVVDSESGLHLVLRTPVEYTPPAAPVPAPVPGQQQQHRRRRWGLG